MRIPLPAAITSFGSSAWEVCKARPVSILLAAPTIKNILDKATCKKSELIDGDVIVITSALVIYSLYLKELEPVCMANLVSNPLSTVIGIGITGYTLRAAINEGDSIGFPMLGLSLLAATGLRCYGPSLFTHRYLTWVR